MKKYDVVIIGGSIAGSVTGRYLSEAGISTLIVEAARTPREKPCSGCVASDGAEESQLLDRCDKTSIRKNSGNKAGDLRHRAGEIQAGETNRRSGFDRSSDYKQTDPAGRTSKYLQSGVGDGAQFGR